VDNTIKLAAAGIAFLILLVIGASTSNSFKYYLVENQGALEIWKGKFAPLGKKKVLALPGVVVPEELKDAYSSDEVYPLAFQYYIDKADALLEVPGIPDFEAIKKTLKTALEYGSSSELRDVAYQRLDNIDRLILDYKADVAASRGTIEGLTAAIGFLKEADKLTRDEVLEQRIAQKIAAHETAIAALEEQAEAEAEAARLAEEAAAEEAAAQEAEAAAEAETQGEQETPEAESEAQPEAEAKAEEGH
jgi:colicin import membrane protein